MSLRPAEPQPRAPRGAPAVVVCAVPRLRPARGRAAPLRVWIQPAPAPAPAAGPTRAPPRRLQLPPNTRVLVAADPLNDTVKFVLDLPKETLVAFGLLVAAYVMDKSLSKFVFYGAILLGTAVRGLPTFGISVVALSDPAPGNPVVGLASNLAILVKLYQLNVFTLEDTNVQASTMQFQEPTLKFERGGEKDEALRGILPLDTISVKADKVRAKELEVLSNVVNFINLALTNESPRLTTDDFGFESHSVDSILYKVQENNFTFVTANNESKSLEFNPFGLAKLQQACHSYTFCEKNTFEQAIQSFRDEDADQSSWFTMPNLDKIPGAVNLFEKTYTTELYAYLFLGSINDVFRDEAMYAWIAERLLDSIQNNNYFKTLVRYAQSPSSVVETIQKNMKSGKAGLSTAADIVSEILQTSSMQQAQDDLMSNLKFKASALAGLTVAMLAMVATLEIIYTLFNNRREISKSINRTVRSIMQQLTVLAANTDNTKSFRLAAFRVVVQIMFQTFAPIFSFLPRMAAFNSYTMLTMLTVAATRTYLESETRSDDLQTSYLNEVLARSTEIEALQQLGLALAPLQKDLDNRLSLPLFELKKRETRNENQNQDRTQTATPVMNESLGGKLSDNTIRAIIRSIIASSQNSKIDFTLNFDTTVQENTENTLKKISGRIKSEALKFKVMTGLEILSDVASPLLKQAILQTVIENIPFWVAVAACLAFLQKQRTRSLITSLGDSNSLSYLVLYAINSGKINVISEPFIKMTAMIYHLLDDYAPYMDGLGRFLNNLSNTIPTDTEKNFPGVVRELFGAFVVRIFPSSARANTERFMLPTALMATAIASVDVQNITSDFDPDNFAFVCIFMTQILLSSGRSESRRVVHIETTDNEYAHRYIPGGNSLFSLPEQLRNRDYLVKNDIKNDLQDTLDQLQTNYELPPQTTYADVQLVLSAIADGRIHGPIELADFTTRAEKLRDDLFPNLQIPAMSDPVRVTDVIRVSRRLLPSPMNLENDIGCLYRDLDAVLLNYTVDNSTPAAQRQAILLARAWFSPKDAQKHGGHLHPCYMYAKNALREESRSTDFRTHDALMYNFVGDGGLESHRAPRSPINFEPSMMREDTQARARREAMLQAAAKYRRKRDELYANQGESQLFVENAPLASSNLLPRNNFIPPDPTLCERLQRIEVEGTSLWEPKKGINWVNDAMGAANADIVNHKDNFYELRHDLEKHTDLISDEFEDNALVELLSTTVADEKSHFFASPLILLPQSSRCRALTEGLLQEMSESQNVLPVDAEYGTDINNLCEFDYPDNEYKPFKEYNVQFGGDQPDDRDRIAQNNRIRFAIKRLRKEAFDHILKDNQLSNRLLGPAVLSAPAVYRETLRRPIPKLGPEKAELVKDLSTADLHRAILHQRKLAFVHNNALHVLDSKHNSANPWLDPVESIQAYALEDPRTASTTDRNNRAEQRARMVRYWDTRMAEDMMRDLSQKINFTPPRFHDLLNNIKILRDLLGSIEYAQRKFARLGGTGGDNYVPDDAGRGRSPVRPRSAFSCKLAAAAPSSPPSALSDTDLRALIDCCNRIEAAASFLPGYPAADGNEYRRRVEALFEHQKRHGSTFLRKPPPPARRDDPPVNAAARAALLAA